MKKIVSLLLVSALVSFLVVSCNKNSSRKLANYDLVKGQCMSSANGNNFTVCFDSLITECRCPIGITCVWAGYAAVRLSFHQNGTDISFPLALSPGTSPAVPYRQDTTINQVTISLKDVSPYPSVATPPTSPAIVVDVRE